MNEIPEYLRLEPKNQLVRRVRDEAIRLERFLTPQAGDAVRFDPLGTPVVKDAMRYSGQVCRVITASYKEGVYPVVVVEFDDGERLTVTAWHFVEA